MADENSETTGTVVAEQRPQRTYPKVRQLDEGQVLLQVIARAAQDPTVDLDRMERLLVMHERLNAKDAERQYTEAMAQFKQNAPTILKDRKAGFDHRDGGGRTEYAYATLGGVVKQAVGGLAAVGISASWDVQQPNGAIVVSCILTHKAGHSEKRTLTAHPDKSGKKNAIQEVASTITYLERYTFLAATGLAVEDQDDDGRSAGADREYITEDQVANLEALITEVGSNKINFLGWARVDQLEDILATNYKACVEALERKRNQ